VIFRPILLFQWCTEWAAFFLGRWVLLEVLEYCGTLSLLVAVIFYFAGARDRREQKHYQAWQVINTAQGKGGNGGRIDALQELNIDGVPLVGVDLSDAYLQGVNLPNANLLRATLDGTDLRDAVLSGADLEECSMVYGNLRRADLHDARLGESSNFKNADFNGADLSGADLDQASFAKADLRNANLDGVKNWQSIKSIQGANIFGCRNPPAGFMDWAMKNGAMQISSDEQWVAELDRATTEPSGK